jgi:hypothetical protein
MNLPKYETFPGREQCLIKNNFMKEYGGGGAGDKPQSIFSLGTTWRWTVDFMLRQIYLPGQGNPVRVGQEV